MMIRRLRSSLSFLLCAALSYGCAAKNAEIPQTSAQNAQELTAQSTVATDSACTTPPVTGLQVSPTVLHFNSGAPSYFTICTQYPSTYTIRPSASGIVTVSATHITGVKDPVTGIYKARVAVSALLPGTLSIRVYDTKFATYVGVYVVKLNRHQLYALLYQPSPYLFTTLAYAANSLGDAKPFGQIPPYGGSGAIGVDPVSRVYLGTTNIRWAAEVYASICAPLLHLGELEIPDRSRAIGPIAIGPNGDIYISTSNYQETLQYIYVFPAGSLGNVLPKRSIYVPQAANLDVDSKGYLYILNAPFAAPADRILVYSPTADGAATPVRTIYRHNTDLLDIKVDSVGRIYTSGYTGGTVYAPNASGYATPIAETPVREGVAYQSVAVSPTGTVYFGVEPAQTANIPPGDIVEYTFGSGGFAFLGTLHTGVPASDAFHLAIGP